MISVIKQKYHLLEKIDKYHGFCENNNCVLIYKQVFYKYYIYAAPDWFLWEIHKNKTRLKSHQQLKVLYLNKHWKIDEVRKIL